MWKVFSKLKRFHQGTYIQYLGCVINFILINSQFNYYACKNIAFAFANPNDNKKYCLLQHVNYNKCLLSDNV